MTVTNLSFELVSDPALIKFTHRQNSNNWKAKLTHEQYIEREWVIGVESEQCKRNEEEHTGVYHFVLRDRSIDSGGDEFKNIVASCETRNRHAWRAEKGTLKRVVSPCIGSVYTLPEHRKKGYAGNLIEMLNEYWAERLDKDSFITLYSEVGEYYTRFGYTSYEVKTHAIPIPELLEVKEPGYDYLRFEQYDDLIKEESDSLIKKLISKSKTTDIPLVSLHMELDTFTWFHLRDVFIGSKVNPEYRNERFGALLKDGTEDHLIWLHDWNDDNLTVLKLKFSSVESFESLLDLAFKEAKEAGLHHVDLWDSALGEDESLHKEAYKYISGLKGVALNLPNDSLGALKLFQPFKVCSWENNDKWCWF